jgi:DNA mismatch repair ATPase MutS
MEETKVICEEATENSLVLIDELGKKIYFYFN